MNMACCVFKFVIQSSYWSWFSCSLTITSNFPFFNRVINAGSDIVRRLSAVKLFVTYGDKEPAIETPAGLDMKKLGR